MLRKKLLTLVLGVIINVFLKKYASRLVGGGKSGFLSNTMGSLIVKSLVNRITGLK